MKILIEIDTDTQRVVPVDATHEMCEAAHFGPNCAEEKLCGSYREFWEECYRAMLAVAPQPEQETAEAIAAMLHSNANKCYLTSDAFVLKANASLIIDGAWKKYK